MPKIADYPRVSFKTAYDLASSVDLLGGQCSIQSCAESLKLKVSGSFNALVSATSKYGLTDNKSGQISTTQLYKNIKLAYDDNERIDFQRISFFSISLFSKLYDRFKGKPLPINMLDKLLIREFGVEENIATRVKNIFIEGVKDFRLLEADNKLIDYKEIEEHSSNSNVEIIEDNLQPTRGLSNSDNKTSDILQIQDSNEYSFHIVGPGINTKITIVEEEDFDILNAVIRKIKKRLSFIDGSI